MPGQWGQKPGENDWVFNLRKQKEREESEAGSYRQTQVNVDLVNNLGVLLFNLIRLLFHFASWVLGLIFKLLKYFTGSIDHTLSRFIAQKYQRNFVLLLMYIAIVVSSLYVTYLNNVFGFYSLNKLVTALKSDDSFRLTIKKTTYKYYSHSYDHPEAIKLIGVSGPGMDKIIDVFKVQAANGMLNSENKKPIDLLPELAGLIKQEPANTPTTASTSKKAAQKQKKIKKQKPNSDNATLPVISEPHVNSSREPNVTASTPIPEVSATQDQ